MAVETSRTFTCDVDGCASKEVVPSAHSRGDAHPVVELPHRWHSFKACQSSVAGHATDGIHCPLHTYRFDADQNILVTVPKIRRPRKTGGAE